MRHHLLAVLCGVLSIAPQTSAATKPKPKAAAATGKPTAKAKSGKAVAARTKVVRTKAGRLVRVPVHAPPAPSFQTHPDPERYMEIQKALADRGYFKGEVNGQWGDDSTDALRRFQAGSNLPDDGRITALTLSGLGLGPRHDGSSASTVPLPAEVPAPSVTGSTVGPAASAPAPPPSPPE